MHSWRRLALGDSKSQSTRSHRVLTHAKQTLFSTRYILDRTPHAAADENQRPSAQNQFEAK